MERMTRLVLVRHLQTDMAGRFCGHSDPELNEQGRCQLSGLLKTLSEYAIQRVYASDLRRAQETADAIAKHFKIKLHIRSGLREIHFGEWEGFSWDEIVLRDPITAKRWTDAYPNSTAPGGEPIQQFQLRVREEVDFLLHEVTRSASAVVTHAGFMRVVLTRLCGLSEQEAWSRTRRYGSVIALDADHKISHIGELSKASSAAVSFSSRNPG
jgi:alpha-ribazole phosphatase/probable phosphoglycerate mutase